MSWIGLEVSGKPAWKGFEPELVLRAGTSDAQRDIILAQCICPSSFVVLQYCDYSTAISCCPWLLWPRPRLSGFRTQPDEAVEIPCPAGLSCAGKARSVWVRGLLSSFVCFVFGLFRVSRCAPQNGVSMVILRTGMIPELYILNHETIGGALVLPSSCILL